MRGWPLLVYYCDVCHYSTPVSPAESPDQPLQHNCAHCGLKSSGADTRTQPQAKMDYSQHDELAALFAQNMQLSPAARQQIEQMQQNSMFEQATQLPEKQLDSPVHFISAHYTGTAHVRAETASEPSRSPPPSYHEALLSKEAIMEATLRDHGIEVSTLLANQQQLFLNADHEQRTRLIELWRIAPPSYSEEDHRNGHWTTTSIEREEALAKQRYEQNLAQLAARPAYLEEQMLDTHVVPEPEEPMSPIREVGEPAFPPAARMRAASIASSRPSTRHGDAEPYMLSLAHDQAARSFDPVYAGPPGLWHVPAFQTSSNQMEDQYGMYEQIRNHADWERMNERIARERLGLLHSSPNDDEMML